MARACLHRSASVPSSTARPPSPLPPLGPWRSRRCAPPPPQCPTSSTAPVLAGPPDPALTAMDSAPGRPQVPTTRWRCCASAAAHEVPTPSAAAKRREVKEYVEAAREMAAGTTTSRSSARLTPWRGLPSEVLTPRLAGTFKLTLQFTEDYPNKPPNARFVSRMFHPNMLHKFTCRD